MHWTSPDGRDQHGLLSRPLEAPAASVGVGWTPVAEEVRDSFLGVERTTSLEAERHDKALGYRLVMRQRLKPWGSGRSAVTCRSVSDAPDREIGHSANKVLKSLHFKTICPTHACTKPTSPLLLYSCRPHPQ